MITRARINPKLNVGIIGTGFMGRSHAIAYALASTALGLPYRIQLAGVADVAGTRARDFADEMSFEWSTTDWEDLVDSPDIDVVSIAAPTDLHCPIALRAIRNGKHVHCEKPLASSIDDARLMSQAARDGECVTQVGFNYISNPVVMHIKKLIEDGVIGEIRTFRAIHANHFFESFQQNKDFRLIGAGAGVLNDLGSHVLATVEFVLGPISAVSGRFGFHSVENALSRRSMKTKVPEDVVHASVQMNSGAFGSIEASWLSTGRTMQHDLEIYGTEGSITFSQERLSEFNLYLKTDLSTLRGFRRIEAGPQHEPYGRLCAAQGHQLGFNELKAIEMGAFIRAISDRNLATFDFERAFRVTKLTEAVRTSAENDAVWVNGL